MVKKPITKPLLSPHVDQLDMGFSTVVVKSRPFTNLHRHNELEIVVTLHGSQRAVFGRRPLCVEPNRLLVFWANTPHGPVQVDPGNVAINLFVPIPWFLNWTLPKRFVESILHGEVYFDRPHSKPCSDTDLMWHWVELMKHRDGELQRIVLLEVEARLRLLAHNMSAKITSSAADPAVEPSAYWNKYEQIVSLLAHRYREPLTVPQVAKAVGLHPVYAMRLFRKMSGTTIGQCIIQHRIMHAQQLIATTDKKILTIAMESGFNSACQFYVAFRRIVGQTPRKYRRSLRG